MEKRDRVFSVTPYREQLTTVRGDERGFKRERNNVLLQISNGMYHKTLLLQLNIPCSSSLIVILGVGALYTYTIAKALYFISAKLLYNVCI